MKLGALALLAVLTLTSCGTVSATLNHIADPTPSPTHTPSCHRLFIRWDYPHGHKVLIAKLKAETKTVSARGKARSLAEILREGRRLGRLLAEIPQIPYCADPHGYLARAMGKFNIAVNAAQPTDTFFELKQALAPMNRIPKLWSKLRREVKETTGHRFGHKLHWPNVHF